MQRPLMREWEQVSLTPDPIAGAVLSNVTHTVERIQEELKKLPEICESSLPS